MRVLAIASMGTILTSAAIFAQIGSSSRVPAADERVAAAVASLSSDDYRLREKGSRDLAAIGDRALPQLAAALKATDDPEVARRIEVIVQKLEDSRLLTARRVTVVAKSLSASKILADISKQSGYKIVANGIDSNEQNITVEIRDLPVWEAIEKICDAGGWSAYVSEEDGSILVNSNDAANPHTAYVGPLKVTATNINTNKNLQLSGIPRRQAFPRQPEYLYVNLQITSEPKAPILALGQPEIVTATDDTGSSMTPPEVNDPNNQVAYYPPQPSYRTFSTQTSVNLVRGGRGASSIKKLRLKVPVTLMKETRTELTIENILKAKDVKAAGRSTEVTIRSATADENGQVSIGLTATRVNGPPDDYAWGNTLYQRLELYDDKGQKYRANGLNEQNVSGNAATLGILFGSDGNTKHGKPSKLVLVEWIGVTKEFAFDLADIPLP